LALARRGFRVTVLEQAARLEEPGAGIQLSPNASRILIDLGLGGRLRACAIVPEGLRVLAASGREIVRMPLGAAAEQRYGAPYWLVHRGDLQAALAGAAAANLNVSLRLGMRLEDFAALDNSISVSAQVGGAIWHERAEALLAADGLWSVARARMGFRDTPRFVGRSAWRALVPVAMAPPEFREPVVHLWLGGEAHVVHYPIKGGSLVNVVVIAEDQWQGTGWSAPASRAEVMGRLPAGRWASRALALISLPDHWLKWALYDRGPLSTWSYKAAALIGDAAHPMLPYLAQGAAMAIEDAAVAAHCLAQSPDDAAAAWRRYCALRRPRTRKVQRLAARNGARYHRGALAAALRNVAMRSLGGARLLQHYDWLYDWRPPPGGARP